MENKDPIDIAAVMNDVFNPSPDRLSHASDASDDDDLTPPDNAPKEMQQLRDCQRKAISAIMKGKGYTYAASVAGVT